MRQPGYGAAPNAPISLTAPGVAREEGQYESSDYVIGLYRRACAHGDR